MNDTYVTPINVTDIFADPTYQRPLDASRARKVADGWEPRLAGIIEVSDRGADASPRYAVIDGQHRWAAADYAQIGVLVANVHTGLTLAVVTLYNQRPGRKILVSTRTFGGTARNAHSTPALAAVTS